VFCNFSGWKNYTQIPFREVWGRREKFVWWIGSWRVLCHVMGLGYRKFFVRKMVMEV
jgi:hypothetical protein